MRAPPPCSQGARPGLIHRKPRDGESRSRAWLHRGHHVDTEPGKRLSSVADDYGPGDELCRIAGQEEREIRDLILRRETPEGNAARELLLYLGGRGEALHSFRVVDRARGDRVDAHAVWSPLDREALGEHVHARFRRADVRLHRRWGERLHRRDVYDRSPRPPQMLKDRPAGVESSEQIDIDNGFEPVRRHPECWCRKIPGGATNNEIDLTVDLTRRLYRGGESVVVPHIGGMTRCDAASPSYF